MSSAHIASIWRVVAVGALAVVLLVDGIPARAEVSGGVDVNMSKMANYQNECAIIKNPSNKLQLFSACNNATGGLFAARSVDGGLTWTYPDPSKTIANGSHPALGPAACCDPSLAWDTFGNLFVTYIDASITNVVTLLSTDGGQTFVTLAQFGPGSFDQPTVTADAGEVWIVWNQSNQMVARGAAVTGLGAAAIGAFGALQTIPGTTACSFGDIAIAPDGAVVQTCESPDSTSGPASILVNVKADGLGPNPFGPAVTATATNVGGFHFIPAQNVRSIDAEAGLAYDRNPTSPHFGRLYLVYTDEPTFPDTDIMLRFSDNNAATWSNPPVRVNDDNSGKSQFLPRIASNRLSGNVGVCWHDARNSPANNTMQEYCTIATPTGASPAFMANAQISDGTSTATGSSPPVSGQVDIQFGDYSGLTYFQGLAHPAWADDSNSTGDNPDGTSRYDAYTDRVTGGTAANEGDPHLTTVDGIHYDFQGAGEFVSLRDADGLQIQTRQSPIATASVVGPNPYTGLTTCVSLNTAVAAKVGAHRVTLEPNLSGVPDPLGLQLRVDGNVIVLWPLGGLDLGSGSRVTRIGNGYEIDFPDGTILVVTSQFWTAQGLWYLNVDAFHAPALEGIMGAIARGSWLPALADGTTVGSMPPDLAQRYAVLYGRFADAWRVSDSNSLFDYAPGTSTATFDVPGWPVQRAPCIVPHHRLAKPLEPGVARRICRSILDRNRRADCIFDVTVTGEPGFARLYALSERVQNGSTTMIVTNERDPTLIGEPAIFTAVVTRNFAGAAAPSGYVNFTIDGFTAGPQVKLGSTGRASMETTLLTVGRHQIAAAYAPLGGSMFLASDTLGTTHTVRRCACGTGATPPPPTTSSSNPYLPKFTVAGSLSFPTKVAAGATPGVLNGASTGVQVTAKKPIVVQRRDPGSGLFFSFSRAQAYKAPGSFGSALGGPLSPSSVSGFVDNYSVFYATEYNKSTLAPDFSYFGHAFQATYSYLYQNVSCCSLPNSSAADFHRQLVDFNYSINAQASGRAPSYWSYVPDASVSFGPHNTSAPYLMSVTSDSGAKTLYNYGLTISRTFQLRVDEKPDRTGIYNALTYTASFSRTNNYYDDTPTPLHYNSFNIGASYAYNSGVVISLSAGKSAADNIPGESQVQDVFHFPAITLKLSSPIGFHP
jgi:hypothetical protein